MNDDTTFDTGLWDATACCRFFQTGACAHTEDDIDYDDEEPGDDSAYDERYNYALGSAATGIIDY